MIPKLSRDGAQFIRPRLGRTADRGVPPARRAELARACNLLNARTFLGAWVLNMEAGELYFRHTVLTAGVLFEDAGVRALLQVVVGTVELHVDRLQAVLDGAPAESVLVEID